MLRTCRMCDVPFEQKRTDHFFCSGKCVAAFYRKFPNPENIHADLPHDKPHVCEECGLPYNVNAYAERGGARAPKYCSPACKQRAYRKRGMNPQEQAQRRYQQQQREDAQRRDQDRQRQRTEDARRERERSERSWREHAEREQQRRNGQARRQYPSKMAECAAILGVAIDADKATIKAAYRRLMKQYHPDVNKSAEALEMSKKINAAYEYMK